MYHPGWDAKWQEIERIEGIKPIDHVIYFNRWAERRYGEGSRGAALATEFSLTKITRKLEGEHYGNPTGNEGEQASRTG